MSSFSKKTGENNLFHSIAIKHASRKSLNCYFDLTSTIINSYLQEILSLPTLPTIPPIDLRTEGISITLSRAIREAYAE